MANKLDKINFGGTVMEIQKYTAGQYINVSNNGMISVDPDGLAEYMHEIYGTPLIASTAAGMTDRTRIYVYTGSETGYNNGHWYYWNGSAWADGGVYNSAGVTTDKTLTLENIPADAKATGDQITDLKEDLEDFNSINLLARYGTFTNGAHNGVTFTYSGKGSCTATGTPSGIAFRNIFVSIDSLPDWITPGNSYILNVTSSNTSWFKFAICFYTSGTSTWRYYVSNTTITIPSDCTGIIFRIITDSTAVGHDINLTIGFSLQSTLSNAQLLELINASKDDIEINRKQIATNNIDLVEYFEQTVNTSRSGITYTGNLGETITVFGTASSASYCDLYASPSELPGWLKAGGYYSITCKCTDDNIGFVILYYVNDTYYYMLNTLDYTPRRESFTVKLPDTATGIIARLAVRVNNTVNGTVTVKINPIEPAEILEKDLLYTDRVHNGITYTWADKKCHVVGTATGPSQSYLWYSATTIPKEIISGNVYWFSYNTTDDNARLQLYTVNEAGYGRVNDIGFGKPLVIPYDTVGFGLRISVPDTYTVDAYISDIHIYSKFDYQMPKKLITIIDDDTPNNTAVQRYHDNCLHNGIKGNYAVITYHLEHGDTDKDLLLSYEDEGFGMLTHCYNQSGYQDWNEGSTRNIDNCRENMAKGVRQMRGFGFTTYNYWATPAGLRDREIERLARYFGFRCMVTGFNADWNHADKASRYFIKRLGYQPDDSDVKFSQQTVKDFIDKFMAHDGDGWLIITTHFDTWDTLTWDSTLDENGYPIGYERFNDLIQYAKAQGCEFVSFPEGFSFFEPYCID